MRISVRCRFYPFPGFRARRSGKDISLAHDSGAHSSAWRTLFVAGRSAGSTPVRVFQGSAMAIPYWFSDRRLSREYRRNAKAWGITVPKLKTVVQVQTDAIAIPAWAREHAIPGLESNQTAVWLGRISANVLARLDREAGGQPKLTTTVFRRCRICSRALLGIAAQEQFERDRVKAGIPCGPDCVETARARKRPLGRPKGS